jgi:hypothetical protein
LWLDSKLLIEEWKQQPVTTYEAKVKLEKGRSYDLRLEFFERRRGATCVLEWIVPTRADVLPSRQVWIPPGEWLDAWTGARLTGPKTITVTSPLWRTPMYVRAGGVVLSVPEMQHTGERPWDTVVVDAFVPIGGTNRTERTLYEDDGISPNYQQGAYCTTPVTLETSTNMVRLTAGKIRGEFERRLKLRTWVFRVHLPKGRQVAEMKIARDVESRTLGPAENARSMPFGGAGTNPGPEAGEVVEVRVKDQPTDQPVEVTLTLE